MTLPDTIKLTLIAVFQRDGDEGYETIGRPVGATVFLTRPDAATLKRNIDLIANAVYETILIQRIPVEWVFKS